MSTSLTPTIAPQSGASAPKERSTGLGAIVVKILFLGTVLAFGIFAAPALIRYKLWLWLVLMVAAIVVIFAIYLTKRFIPGKYLFPGTFFLSLFLIVPIVMTVQFSFTNFGDGARGTKEQTTQSILKNSVQMTPDSVLYHSSVAVVSGGDVANGPFTLFLIDQSDQAGTVLYGTADQPLTTWTGAAPTVTGNVVTAAEGYRILTAAEINTALKTIQNETAVAVPDKPDYFVKVQFGTQAYQAKATITYDQATDTLSGADGKTYPNERVGDSNCFADPSDASGCFQGQSWLQNVGWRNYARLVTNADIRGQFLGAFGWTLTYAIGSVVLTFLAGFALALTFNDRRVKAQKVWRSVFLLPYAIPGFISLLMWSQFFNKDFGLINLVFGTHLDWFGNPLLARIAIFIVQLWIGFPYMFIVCTGALQSIPDDVKEAAKIDGATGLATTFRIVLPLLLISVAPLLVASFAFNCNNFNMIRLLTDGAPVIPGQFTRRSTDILISMIYRQAFGNAGTDFGFASALAVLLFILTGALAAFQFRFTRKLEDLT
ncbi:MAG: ABC transporter permease subunit [Propionibacteriaceae bacterium]|jgi:arabinogalactan oligomer/maltooligosaccharide transport system permease protein|nr:ABC transporter permease subunit [Propionibacteriaceae bacterium]